MDDLSIAYLEPFYRRAEGSGRVTRTMLDSLVGQARIRKESTTPYVIPGQKACSRKRSDLALNEAVPRFLPEVKIYEFLKIAKHSHLGGVQPTASLKTAPWRLFAPGKMNYQLKSLKHGFLNFR